MTDVVSFKRSFVLLVGILFLLHYPSYTEGVFHFYSEAGTRKCFYKELASGTLLIGRYKLEILDPDSDKYDSPRDKVNTGVLIDVEETFDLNHRVVHQKGSPNGQFTFSALKSGEHRICITPKSFYKKGWLDGTPDDPAALKDLKFKISRIVVDFLIGDGDIVDSKHSHKVKTLAERVNRINDKLSDVKREQEFIREKEELFRDQSERTCENVVRWLVIQAGAFIITCLYQIISLRKYTVKEKVS